MTLEMFRSGVSEYVKNLENSEYSVNTVNKYSLSLRHFIEFAEANDHCDIICKDCFLEYKEYLRNKYAVNTANLYIVAINKYLHNIGAGELCVKRINTQTNNSLDNCLTAEEYRSMLDIAKRRKNNMIYYIMRVIANTGIRFKGLAYFTVDTIKKGSFVATNKGKTRVIVIPPRLCKELVTYCKDKELTTGYIFHDRTVIKSVSEVTVLRWMKEVAKKAGIDPDKAFPHNLRHLFARRYMEVHNNLGELADILGHTKIETTRIYTRTSIEEKRKNLELIDL